MWYSIVWKNDVRNQMFGVMTFGIQMLRVMAFAIQMFRVMTF